MTSVVNNEPEARKRRVPQQVRSRERVERLLDAAAGLVVTRGVENLSTRGIAESAGIPVASLYQYFADRDDILLALVERDIEAMDQQVLEDLAALPTYSIASIVETTMAAFVKVFLRRPAFVFIWLRGRTNQAIQEYGRAHNRRVAADLHQFALDLGLVDSQAALMHAELAVEVGDRLFQIAFESDVTGDKAVLEEAVKIVTQYLELHATPAGRHGVAAG
jgi:AcrR family transcriptional regulator